MVIAVGYFSAAVLLAVSVGLYVHFHHGSAEARELEREAAHNRYYMSCMWCGRFMLTGTHGKGVCSPGVQQLVEQQPAQPAQPTVVYVVNDRPAYPPPVSPPLPGSRPALGR